MKRGTMMNKNEPNLSQAGKKIIAGLKEIAEALESGTPLARAIKALRRRLGISQRLFAHLMGVSVILEQAWEQGRRFPNSTARRLLDEMRRDPKRWTDMLQPAKAA